MKLKHSLSGLLVVAAGLAIAVPASAQEPRPYAIAVRADVTPVLQTEPAYPYLAARNGISGECRLTIDIADGAARDVQVLSCSSDLFRAQAKRAAARLTFAPGVSAEDSVVIITWSMRSEAPKAMVTASR